MKYLLKIVKKYRLMSKLRQDMDLYYNTYFMCTVHSNKTYMANCFAVTQKTLYKLHKL